MYILWNGSAEFCTHVSTCVIIVARAETHMVLEVEYLRLWFSHEEGPGPVATDEGLVGVLYVTILLVNLDHIFQLTKPVQRKERG